METCIAPSLKTCMGNCRGTKGGANSPVKVFPQALARYVNDGQSPSRQIMMRRMPLVIQILCLMYAPCTYVLHNNHGLCGLIGAEHYLHDPCLEQLTWSMSAINSICQLTCAIFRASILT